MNAGLGLDAPLPHAASRNHLDSASRLRQPPRIPGPTTYDQANSVQRLIRRFASSGPGSWIFARFAHRLDRPVYRITRGRYTIGNLISGLPVVMLTTTGAKSGERRSVPVLGLPTDDGIAIIASNFGQYRHPGWYYNLRANPEAEVAIDGSRQQVRAVEADEQRRERIWQAGLQIYPGFGQYAQRASHRRISVFVLEPRSRG